MIGYIGELGVLKDIKNFKVLLCDNLVWVTNYIKILEYKKEMLKIKVKNNVLIVEGVDIKIKLLEKKEIVLEGKFNNIFLEKPYKVEQKNEKLT